MKTTFCTLLFLSFAFPVYATIVTALSSDATPGDWDNAATWSGGRVPLSSDVVLIPASKGVTVKGVEYSVPALLIVQVFGTLHFEPSGKLDLSSLSQIQLFLGGKIVPKNGSSSQLITIGGVTKYNAANNGTVTGPAFADMLSGVSVAGQAMSGFSFGTPLPVVFTRFSGDQTSEGITLTWQTAGESGIDHFAVERREEGSSYWQLVGQVRAKGAPLAYTFTDNTNRGGRPLYRIKLVYADGEVDYSSTIQLVLTMAKGMSIAPNPSSGSVTVRLAGNDSGKIKITLFNLSGQPVQTLEGNPAQSIFQLQLEGLPKGSYFICVQNGKAITEKQLIVLK